MPTLFWYAERRVRFLYRHLLRDIRDGEPNTGALSKVWDFDMKDRNAQFKDDLREASGIGKRRGRKVS